MKKKNFREAAEMVYLDNSATSLKKPLTVFEAVNDCMMNYGANPGRASHHLAKKLQEKVYEAREDISSFFNIPNPQRLIFTFNATDALSTAITGFLSEGDHVVTSPMEHNSVLRPLYFLKSKGVESDICSADVYGRVRWKDIEKCIKPNTALCVLIHASNVCGTVNDIREIGYELKKRNIIFLVDASQSAGATEIDVLRDNVDILAFSGHKALMGPQGTGGLYVREGIDLRPLRFGGTGSYSLDISQPSEYPDRLESGTLNGWGIVGLAEGVKFIKRTGIHNISSYERQLTGRCLENLSVIKNLSITGYMSTVSRLGVISFTSPKMNPDAIGGILDKEYGIAVRSGYHCAPLSHKILGTEDGGTVRISIGCFNTMHEIDYVSKALSDILR